MPQDATLPTIDFSMLVLSLSQTALVHLGEAPHPEEGEGRASLATRNLPLARQTIDTIEMLEEKTRGNLTEDEAHLLRDLLYDLRARFVEAK
jgi:hypothetical protein